MKATTKAGAAGAAIGLGALALLTPSLVSGGARNTVGSGAAEAAIAKPFVAELSGANEVPGPGDADGVGAAAVTIDPVTGEVCADLSVSGIATATAAHIHEGAVGVAGDIVVELTAPNPTSAGCTTVDTDVAEAIVATPSNYYVNVHNADFTNGAVRGQLQLSETTMGDTHLLDEPLRAYDSRTVPEGILAVGETRVIDVSDGVDGAGASHLAVPPGATGALLRITVTDATNAGFLKVYSNALTDEPATSQVNWYSTGAIVGADATVAIDAEGKIKITVGVNTTHVVVDVVGYVF